MLFLSKVREGIRQKEETVGEIEITVPEIWKAHICTVKTKEVSSMVNHFTKFSDWSRAVRAVARLKRFIREFKGVQLRTNEATNLEERKKDEIAIIKLVQEDAFTEDIQKNQDPKRK